MQPIEDLRDSRSQIAPMAWSEEAQLVLEKTQPALASVTVLIHADPEALSTVTLDAYHVAVGGTLQQIVDGILTPMSFFSKTLLKNRTTVLHV